jgi:hypothetical protein
MNDTSLSRNILGMFRRNEPQLIETENFAAELAAEFDAFTLDPEPTIVDRSAAVISDFLTQARAEKARLETEIAERQARLRDTQRVIDAFQPVIAKLDGDYDPADDARKSYDLAIETKRRRGDKSYPAKREAA